eukprot:1157854-Pelagomonas_calceolata.AAC.6
MRATPSLSATFPYHHHHSPPPPAIFPHLAAVAVVAVAGARGAQAQVRTSQIPHSWVGAPAGCR